MDKWADYGHPANDQASKLEVREVRHTGCCIFC